MNSGPTIRAIGFRAAVVVSVVLLVGMILFTVTLAVQYPVPAIPSVLGAILGAVRFARTSKSRLPEALRSVDALYAALLLPAIVVGSLGYAALSAARISVPDPTVAIGWRIFGGAVLGAVGGLAAALGMASAIVLTMAFRVVLGGRGSGDGAA